MKTLLRDKRTACYFQGLSDWTPSVNDAFDFHAPERVVRFVRLAGLNLREVEIVFAFDQPGYNICLPIDERFDHPLVSSGCHTASPESLTPSQLHT
jgi:hypothetical protein